MFKNFKIGKKLGIGFGLVLSLLSYRVGLYHQLLLMQPGKPVKAEK